MSKVIVKISFKHPNLKSARGSNVAHMKYIATRPGVDKSLTEEDLRKELSGHLSDEDYAKYINERPNSHGLFDSKGIADFEAVKSEIANNKGIVWRMIVSLREEDAIKLGYDNKSNWQDLLRMKMPDVAFKMGIKLDNLRWVAAVHMEKGHPHAHVMIWEDKPEIKVGVIKPKIVNEIRKLYIDEIFHEEKMMYLNEKNAMRDLIREFAKNDMSKLADIMKEVSDTREEVNILTKTVLNIGLPPRLYPEVENELIKRMNDLKSILPGHGRANLKFFPENVKDEVRKFAEYILSLDQYKPSVEKYLNAVRNNVLLYNSDENNLKAVLDRSYNDLRDRIGQVILKAAVDISKVNNETDYYKGNTVPSVYDFWKSVFKTIERIRKSEELTALHRKKTLARYSSLESKAARKEFAKKLSQPGLIEDARDRE